MESLTTQLFSIPELELNHAPTGRHCSQSDDVLLSLLLATETRESLRSAMAGPRGVCRTYVETTSAIWYGVGVPVVANHKRCGSALGRGFYEVGFSKNEILSGGRFRNGNRRRFAAGRDA
jgi:hypothetical protein